MPQVVFTDASGDRRVVRFEQRERVNREPEFVFEASDGKDSLGVKRWRAIAHDDFLKDLFPLFASHLFRRVADLEAKQADQEGLRAGQETLYEALARYVDTPGTSFEEVVTAFRALRSMKFQDLGIVGEF